MADVVAGALELVAYVCAAGAFAFWVAAFRSTRREDREKGRR